MIAAVIGAAIVAFGAYRRSLPLTLAGVIVVRNNIYLRRPARDAAQSNN